MSMRVGLSTRERIMAEQPQAASLLELAERAELSASAYHFDVLLGERHPLLAAEQRVELSKADVEAGSNTGRAE